MSTYNGVIEKKLALLDDYYLKAQTLVPASHEALARNWERQKAIERVLQVMVEIMIDIADRFIALHNHPPAATSAESMQKLKELGIISDAGIYAQIVRFRNFIVHRYEQVDSEIMYAIMTNHLDDFLKYIREIHDFITRNP